MDHKYFIDDHLQDEERVLDVHSWFEPEAAERFQFSTFLKSQTIENLEESQKALALRLQSNHYPQVLEERLRLKLPRFDQWLQVIRGL